MRFRVDEMGVCCFLGIIRLGSEPDHSTQDGTGPCSQLFKGSDQSHSFLDDGRPLILLSANEIVVFDNNDAYQP
jgi:hypothetical protein